MAAPVGRPLARARRVLATLALAGMASLACGDEDGDAPGTDPRRAIADAPSGAPARDADARGPRVAGWPPPGQAHLQLEDGHVTLIANDAPRRPLLVRLAHAAGFEVEVSGLADDTVRTRIENTPLRDALPLLLRGRPYRIDFGLDPRTGVHRVVRVEVGAPGAVLPPMGADPSSDAEAARSRGTLAPPPPGEDAQSLRSRRWAALLEQIDDGDAAQRVEAVRRVEPTGEGLEALVERLRDDRSALVRAAAALQLESAGRREAVEALVAALDDPEREVVLAAIDALEFVDDETVVEDLRPLLSHPDAEIAGAARDAIAFITD